MTDHVYTGVSTVFSAFCVSIHFPRLFPPRLYLFLVLSVSSFDFRLLLSKNDRRIYIPCNSILISCHGCVLLSGSLSRWLFCISPAVVARCARPAPRHGVGRRSWRCTGLVSVSPFFFLILKGWLSSLGIACSECLPCTG